MSLFNFGSAPSTAAPAASPSIFSSSFQTQLQQQQQPQQQQQQPQQQQQLQPGQLNLFTNDRTPVGYNTKWSEIHPDSQRLLQTIEEKILEYRDECRRLDQCERLYDTSLLSKDFELDATRLSQELSSVNIAIEREQASLQDLMKRAKDMLRNAEVAVRSFMIICLRFPRPSATAAATGTAPSHASQVSDFYSGFPSKPSPFLQHTVAKLEARILEYRQWIEELEKLLLRNDKEDGRESQASLLQSLPTVMTNVHDFFVYVAAQVEFLHEYLEKMRLAYLADQRRRGDDNNPFVEADRRETAKREAAARRVHPSVLRPSDNNSSTTPALGMPTSSSTVSAPHFQLSAPTAATATSILAPTTNMYSTPASSAPKPKARTGRRK